MAPIALVLLCALLPPTAVAAAKPVSAEDLFRIALVSQAQIAPNANAVAFVVSRMNGVKNRTDTNLWLADTTSGAAQAITDDGESGSPCWSPDGRQLAFVRRVDGKPQIFAHDVRTGTARQLTSLPQGATDPLWSHDGAKIAFTAITADSAPAAHIDFQAAGFEPAADQRASDIRIIGTARYEANGSGYTYDKHRHLWVMQADGSGQTPLTRDERWSEEHFAWSSEDQRLAFTSLHGDPPQANQSEIYTIAAAGGEPQLLKSSHTAETGPVFLHGGARLAHFSGDVTDSAEYPALVISAPDGSQSATVVAHNRIAWGDLVLGDLKMPAGPCGPLLTPDDRHFITNATLPGSAALVVIDMQTGAARPLGRTDGEAFDCSMSADGAKIAYIFADFLHPPEVHLVDLRSGKDRVITSLNQSYLAGALLSKPQNVTVKDAKGFSVQAWFMPAVGGGASQRHPTLLDIHGGPQTAFGSTFFHEMQYWTGQGYNVVMLNPQGSVGYGYDFEEALVGDWGAPMFDDVTRVIDVIALRADVDAARLGVLGGSYGGYATLWVIAHTDRFKAAIAERPCSQLATQSLAWHLASSNALGGEYAWGKPWDPASRHAPDSPLTYVENVHTPVLLLHASEDTETPLEQTLVEFSALKLLGREAIFVEVPRENHDFNRVGTPIHRVERLHIFTDWFAKYLKDAGKAALPARAVPQ